MSTVITTEKEQPAKPALQTSIFDTRVMSVDGVETEFDVLVIDKADKWEDATATQRDYELNTPGGGLIKVPVRALSWGEWEDIEFACQFADFGEEDDINDPIASKQRKAQRDRERDIVVSKRRVMVFEISTGKKIPGETVDEKVKWLQRLGSGDADAMFTFIIDNCSGWSDDTQTMLTDFRRANRSKSIREATVFSSFDDLIPVANTFFRMQRPSQKFIVEFPVKHVNDLKKKEIEEATPDPVPPSRPGKNPVTGRPDPNFPKYNWQDAQYLTAVKATHRKKTVMWFDALLTFEVPGSNESEKYEWIRAKPIGDIYKIKSFIQNEIISYQGRVNFF